MTRRRIALLAALSSTLAAGLRPALAQPAVKSRGAGLFVGGGAEVNVVAANPAGVGPANAPGAGGGVVLGYGFTDRWAAYGHLGWAAFRAARGDATGVGSWDLGTRVHFRAGPHALVPFLEAGVSDRALGETVTSGGRTANVVSFRLTPALGGGANLHLAPRAAVSASALWGVGRFAAAGATTARLGVTRPLLHAGLLLFAGR